MTPDAQDSLGNHPADGAGPLRTLPVSSAKIDRQFITELQTQGSPVVDGMAYLADRLGRAAIAEGLETPRQRNRLREAGIRYRGGAWSSQW